jgi:ABC-type transport system substrate-binding protein
MSSYRSWHRHLGVTLAVLLAAAAPSRAEAVLKVIPSADIGQLDPDLAANLIGRTYAQMVFDTLFALDRSMAPKPMMVESEAVSPDRLTYRFTLRPELTFHDGSPVTTRDVIASLQHWMDNSSIGAQLKARLASLTADDARTFTLTLKQPFGWVEFMLAGPGRRWQRSCAPPTPNAQPAHRSVTRSVPVRSAMSAMRASSDRARCSSVSPATSRGRNQRMALPAAAWCMWTASNGTSYRMRPRPRMR